MDRQPALRRRRARGRARFAAAVLAGALTVGGAAGFGGAALWSAVDDDAPSGGASNQPLRVADASDSDDPAPAGSVEQVAGAVLPSVVALDVAVPGAGPGGGGSGVVLTEDGLILTNDHVVSLSGQLDPASAQVRVSFADGSTAEAQVVGTDPLTDTALVQAEGVSGLTPVTIGESSNLDVGEQVVAVGSPYGLDATVTSGIVSALDRPVEVARDEQGNTTAYPAIQTDAAINPGNSGGPLVDMDGHLVGINASIRTAGEGAGAGSIGLGFAIPIDEVMPIVEQLRNGETPTHARLGIQVDDAATRGAATEGAVVVDVGDGTAAADAGLRPGDVITRLDDHVIDTSEALVAIVRSYRPGDSVEVTYLRGDDERTTDLELGSDAPLTPTRLVSAPVTRRPGPSPHL
ncbi:trypsin-like peptidase domain-containing protein [Nocardioides sp. TF02-7]|uniref:S1C family serine protease n=1 Tax=Nocardioides sp. TF02-7 TaxID=2917724 RepID=UPI001F059D36|nr:trypsin-like peptidase domain-containing protein [Nocardioides sp. TF02-7]UMG91440.1 trypsin-like peptidase domain-containing protein [Nocardioides sp. TF02-7]